MDGEHAFFQPIGLEDVVIYLPFLADRWSFKSRIPLYTLMKEDFITKCSICQIPACSINLKTFQFHSSSQMWALFYLTALLDCNYQRYMRDWSKPGGGKKVQNPYYMGSHVDLSPQEPQAHWHMPMSCYVSPPVTLSFPQLSTESCESQMHAVAFVDVISLQGEQKWGKTCHIPLVVPPLVSLWMDPLPVICLTSPGLKH